MTDVAVSQNGNILLVDDEENILSSLKRLLRPLGCRIYTACNGVKGLEVLNDQSVDLIISDMRMPEMDGVEFLQNAANGWPETMRFLLTGYADMQATVDAVNKGKIHNYISKPWNDDQLKMLVTDALERKNLVEEKKRLEALTQKQNEELIELNSSLEQKVQERTAALSEAMDSLEDVHNQLKQSYYASIPVFAHLIELKESELSGHCKRVADYARDLAHLVNVEEEQAQEIYFAALLHNIGKFPLPDDIVVKPYSALSYHEKKVFHKHPIIAETALMSVEQLKPTAKLIRHQHELVSGNGYPDQLSGDEIPLGSKILSIVIDYDELQLGLVNEKKYTDIEAKKHLNANVNNKYDEELVQHFINLLSQSNENEGLVQEKMLHSKELVDGLVLSRDLISNEGMLLLTKGKKLDAGTINKIIALDKCNKQFLTVYVEVQ